MPSRPPYRAPHPKRPLRLSAQSGSAIGPSNSVNSDSDTDSDSDSDSVNKENTIPEATNPRLNSPNPPRSRSGASGSGSGSGSAKSPVGGSVLRVLPLEAAAQLEPAKRGRKSKLEMPPLPQAILDGMTSLERAHHQFFVESIAHDYQIKKPSDFLALHMAALDYVQLLRVQAYQMATGEIISASKLHPGPQVRSWLDSMSTTRRARKEQPSAEDEELARWKDGLRKISS